MTRIGFGTLVWWVLSTGGGAAWADALPVTVRPQVETTESTASTEPPDSVVEAEVEAEVELGNGTAEPPTEEEVLESTGAESEVGAPSGTVPEGGIADGRAYVWTAYGVTWVVLVVLTLAVMRGWEHRIREDEAS